MTGKGIWKRPKIILVADYKRRFIWLEGERPLTSSLAEGVVKILNKLNKISHKPVIFYIKGVGGDMYAFTKIAHMIENLESPVAFVAFDFVRSGCFWITQCGDACSAVAGTKFTFHHAVHHWSGKTEMSQDDYLKGFDRLKLIDAVQFWLFTRRGSPVKAILRLFEREATIFVKEAIKLKLVVGVYNKDSFERDKKWAEKIARVKYKF